MPDICHSSLRELSKTLLRRQPSLYVDTALGWNADGLKVGIETTGVVDRNKSGSRRSITSSAPGRMSMAVRMLPLCAEIQPVNQGTANRMKNSRE